MWVHGRNGEKGKEKRDVGVEAIKSGTNQLQGKVQVFSSTCTHPPHFSLLTLAALQGVVLLTEKEGRRQVWEVGNMG